MSKPDNIRFLRTLQRTRKFDYSLRETNLRRDDVIAFMRADPDYTDAVNRALATTIVGNELAALEKQRAQYEHMEECFERIIKNMGSGEYLSLSDAQCMKRCSVQMLTWKKDMAPLLVTNETNKSRVMLYPTLLRIRTEIVEVSNKIARMADYAFVPARNRTKALYSVLSVDEVEELVQEKPRPRQKQTAPTSAFLDFGKLGTIEFPIKPSMVRRIAAYPNASEYHSANCHRILSEYNGINIRKTENALHDLLSSLASNGTGTFTEELIRLRTYIMGEEEGNAEETQAS